MKKAAFFTILLFVLAVSVNAQSSGAIRIFGGATYATDINETGINIGGEYLFTDRIAGDLSYSYYFGESNRRYRVTNLDGRYYIPSKSDLQYYGLFGLSFNVLKFGGGGSVRNTDTGINFGGGFVYPFSSDLGFHIQAKYNSGFSGQLEVQGGFSFSLN